MPLILILIPRAAVEDSTGAMKVTWKTALLSILTTSVSGFVFPGSGGTKRTALKDELLKISSETKRGLVATPEQKAQAQELFEKLENLNPTNKPIKSPKLNGVWSLEYTTSGSILGKNSPFPRVGPILQTLDTETLSAENSETVSYFGINVQRKVSARLDPQSDSLTNVLFKRFMIGPFGFNAPDSFRGYLDVTYLDDDFRLSRGDKGNIFVLTRSEGETDLT